MNNDLSTTERIDEVCPICQAKYQTSKEAPAPTCGHPNCIREARAQGKPFVVPTGKPVGSPPAATLPTPGKPKKPKRKRS